MAGEAVIINPRRRRHRKATARRRTTSKRRRRVRRNPIMLNSRRRRRSSVRVRSVRRRRVRRNPRLPLLGSVDTGAIVAGTIGYVGARYGATWLLSMLPASLRANPSTQPLVRAGAKAAVGIVVVPAILKMLGKGRLASSAAVGAGIAVLSDLFDSYAANMLPLPAGATLADYETGIITGMGEYETGMLTGGMGDGAYGASAF